MSREPRTNDQGPRTKDQEPRTKSRGNGQGSRRGARRPLLHPEAPKPYDIRERAFLFALRVLEICSKIPSTPEGLIVRGQLARAGTSVGANLEEADGAISKLDQRKSRVIARKEALEARYWLRILSHRWSAAVDSRPDIQEAAEIIRILSRLIQLHSS